MIVHSIRRTSTRSSFKEVAAYVLDVEHSRGDPVDWTLGAYILDTAHEGDKVASVRISNCASVDPGWAVKECLILAGRNKRAEKDKTYHLVVSFPKGERPSDEQLADIEDRLMAAIGFEDHKRISAVHQNTKHWHMHIAVCTVHPTTLRNVTPYYDQPKLQAAAAELEIKHDLARTNHLSRADSRMPSYPSRTSFKHWVSEHVVERLVEAARTAKTWEDLHQVAAQHGVVVKPRGAGLVIASPTNERASMKASAASPDLAFKALTDRLGPYQQPNAAAPETPRMQYDGRPKGADPALWTRYQAERIATQNARKAALAELRVRHLRYAEDLSDWHKQRFQAARARHLNFADRKSTYQTLRSDAQRAHAARKAMEITQRKAVRDQHRSAGWAEFLARETGRGNPAALRSLDRLVTRQANRDETERDGGAVESRGSPGCGSGKSILHRTSALKNPSLSDTQIWHETLELWRAVLGELRSASSGRPSGQYSLPPALSPSLRAASRWDAPASIPARSE